MKKYSITNVLTLIVVLFSFQLGSCQTRTLTESPAKSPFNIEMTVDFEKWKSNRYDAITFSDPDQPGGGIKGRSFTSKVGPQLPIKWTAKIINTGKMDLEVILITVFRDPINGGDQVLLAPWYNSKNGGRHIMGRTRNFVLKNEKEEILEHYLISFAITDNGGKYDIYTIDPILRGHQ